MATTLADVADDLREQYPHLFASEVDGNIHVQGGHSVLGPEGGELARYGILIVLPPTFPDHLPKVFETTGLIARTPDNHTYIDGSCCVGVPAAVRKRLGPQFQLSSFISGPMNDYFIGQALVAAGKPWPVGEARHGVPGIYDYWAEELQALAPYRIGRLLKYASKGKLPRKNGRCPCGRHTMSRTCHGEVVKRLIEQYPKGDLARDGDLISAYGYLLSKNLECKNL
jgi:hypothetical protein